MTGQTFCKIGVRGDDGGVLELSTKATYFRVEADGKLMLFVDGEASRLMGVFAPGTWLYVAEEGAIVDNPTADA